MEGPPVAVKVEDPGTHTTVGEAVTLRVGVGNTWMEELAVPQTVPWQAVNDTVYVPEALKVMDVVPLFAGLKTTLGEEADQVKLVGAEVEVKVAVKVFDWQTGEGNVNEMLIGGVVVVGTDKVTSSTAMEGSVPAPSSSFCHEKPIFTAALLLALAGSAIVAAVHFPCPPQPVLFD